MNKTVVLVTITALAFASCKSCSNKVGNVVGESVGEFSEGVSKGAEKAFDIVVTPSAALKEKGLNIGKVLLSSDSTGHDNKLSVYMVFDKDFENAVTIKVSDAKGLEMGRAKQEIKAKKDDAKYVDFVFDKRTNIDSDSKIVIE